jgi:hypothetical protein
MLESQIKSKDEYINIASWTINIKIVRSLSDYS